MKGEPFAIAGTLDDDPVAGVGQQVQGAVAEKWVVEETEPILHGPVGCDDVAVDSVTANYELVAVSRLLGCKALEAEVIDDLGRE